jgi:putative oxidoreductase
MLNQSRLDDIGKFIVRLMVGILILLHGLHKVLNPASLDSIRNMLASISLPSLLAYGVYFGEVVGAMMVILGIYSRIGGLLVAATCYLPLCWPTARRSSR